MANEYEGGDLDIMNVKELTSSKVNNFISWFIKICKDRNYKDEALWENYCDHFEDWTKEVFVLCSKQALTDLRDYLRENGVFVYKARGASKVDELAKVISEPLQHIWSKEEIQYQIDSSNTFNSKYNPITVAKTSRKLLSPDRQSTIRGDITNSQGDYKPLIPAIENQPAIEDSFYLHNNSSNADFKGPQFGRELSNLSKIYKDDMLYSGGDDSLDLKLRMFKDLCTKAQIPKSGYSEAFSSMLTGTARN